MKKVGYAKTSTKCKNLDTQINMLNKQNVNTIFIDHNSKSIEFTKMISSLDNGDLVVIDSLDCLGDKYKDIIKALSSIKNKESTILVINLSKNINERDFINESTQKLLFNLITFLDKNEQSEHDRNQKEGVRKAKYRGVYKGRPKKYDCNNDSLRKAVKMYLSRDHNKLTVSQISKLTGISRSSIYRNKNILG